MSLEVSKTYDPRSLEGPNFFGSAGPWEIEVETVYPRMRYVGVRANRIAR